MNKQLLHKSKSMEKGKKGWSKAKTRRNEKKVQKKSVVQENIDQNKIFWNEVNIPMKIALLKTIQEQMKILILRKTYSMMRQMKMSEKI